MISEGWLYIARGGGWLLFVSMIES
jgi:hypothetical protein